MASRLLVDGLLLAEGANADGAPPGWLTILPFVVIGVLFYLMMIKPERQKQSAHQAMLGQLKKNDRVVTIGGIKGIVTNVQKDTDEVTINIDESTGTKIKVTMASIARMENADSKGAAKNK